MLSMLCSSSMISARFTAFTVMFLNVFREIRNSSGKYVIRCIIAAGMTNLNNSVSSFNSGIHVQNSNFTLEEVGQLLGDFAKDCEIQIDNDVIQMYSTKRTGMLANSIDINTEH